MRLDKFNPRGLGFGISLGYILLQQAWLVQKALTDVAHSCTGTRTRVLRESISLTRAGRTVFIGNIPLKMG